MGLQAGFFLARESVCLFLVGQNRRKATVALGWSILDSALGFINGALNVFAVHNASSSCDEV